MLIVQWVLYNCSKVFILITEYVRKTLIYAMLFLFHILHHLPNKNAYIHNCIHIATYILHESLS